jgi:hypothetical protein
MAHEFPAQDLQYHRLLQSNGEGPVRAVLQQSDFAKYLANLHVHQGLGFSVLRRNTDSDQTAA